MGLRLVRVSFGGVLWRCQRKIEMSYSLQSRNVLFCIADYPGHVRLMVPAREARSLVG